MTQKLLPAPHSESQLEPISREINIGVTDSLSSKSTKLFVGSWVLLEAFMVAVSRIYEIGYLPLFPGMSFVFASLWLCIRFDYLIFHSDPTIPFSWQERTVSDIRHYLRDSEHRLKRKSTPGQWERIAPILHKHKIGIPGCLQRYIELSRELARMELAIEKTEELSPSRAMIAVQIARLKKRKDRLARHITNALQEIFLFEPSLTIESETETELLAEEEIALSARAEAAAELSDEQEPPPIRLTAPKIPKDEEDDPLPPAA